MYDNPEMYTEEANQAVIHAILKIETMAEHDLNIRNREGLEKVARPILRAVGEKYPELWDTEPRCWVNDYLDKICRMHGWYYNEDNYYDW